MPGGHDKSCDCVNKQLKKIKLKIKGNKMTILLIEDGKTKANYKTKSTASFALKLRGFHSSDIDRVLRDVKEHVVNEILI